MSRKLRWGVLGAAGIAVKKVIPGMRQSRLCEVAAIASRDPEKAAAAAAQLDIPAYYGSYEAMLKDPDIDVIYNPLPNHLHVPWSIKALEAGKHVLCEKPLGLSSEEIRSLIAVRNRTGLQAGEAFMVKTHPQWVRVKDLVDSGQLGRLRAVECWFSYDNRDPQNVRNVAEYGGGGLMDIGCYPIFIARLLFGEEPVRAKGALEFDPVFKTDRLASAVLEFPSGHCAFTCSTQIAPAQRVVAICEQARIEVEIPFNAPPERACRIFVDPGSDLAGGSRQEETFPACDQYGIQADEFTRAVLGEREVPVPLENSLGTMAVIEQLRAGA
ncbi:MAG: Gfo/Idh/MocA family oxidoreductase [Acidobacteria bacterium]|nr:Gfo/Idh/MocA family oxidoreductase [Acidobacteriota bacterium]